jgi:diaminohydroxyphosphoribosylaminopyrimidine deaminase/5-amino-6-(5-phosphoribosylamino)uracil reductase
VRTAGRVPVLVAVGEDAPAHDIDRLRAAGCEVFVSPGGDHAARLDNVLTELGRRRMTNVLVEGGGRLLGSLLDAGQIDEVHALVAPRLFGGAGAPGPLAGSGVARVEDAAELEGVEVASLGGDLYMHGRIVRKERLAQVMP